MLIALSRPFKPEEISWRPGATNRKKVARETNDPNAKPTKALGLAYIDARDVRKRLEQVLPLQWQCQYTHVGKDGVICSIGLLINGEWLWRANGAGENRDIEAEKSAMSDAFKRAATMWGVGTYLYGLKNIWCDLDEWGRIVKVPELPVSATPAGFDAIINKRNGQ